MQLNRFMIRPYVEQALRDEIGPGDTTGGFLVGEDPVQTAQIYAKGSGIVCGLLLADETIRTVDPDAPIGHTLKDGEEMEPGKARFKVEVECETLDMVQEALDCGVEVIMFDNMDLNEIKAGLKLVNGRASSEASGGINERTIVVIAETGVDVISVGDLTHSVTSVDISLDVRDIKPSAIRTIERLRTAAGA